MKEIISAALFVVSLYGGTIVLKKFHNHLREAALSKAAEGLPSLTEMHRRLRIK